MIPAIGDQIAIHDGTEHPPGRSARLIVTMCREIRRSERPWPGDDEPERVYAVQCDVYNDYGGTRLVNTCGFDHLEIGASGNLRPIPRPAGQRQTDPFEIVVVNRPERHQANLF